MSEKVITPLLALETELISSILNNPKELDSFLKEAPLKLFSKQAQYILTKLTEFLDEKKGEFSLNAFVARLGERVAKSEYFLDMLSQNATSNYVAFAATYRDAYLLEKQKEIGENLINAASDGQRLDISAFGKELEIESKKFKNFATLESELDNLPSIPKVKSGVDFLDLATDGGFELGQLVLISGDKEAGKTMLGLQMLEFMALTQKVAFFAFEFTTRQYINRQRGNLSKTQKENVFVIADGYDINEVAANIKELYRLGFRVFLIDSQMRITTPRARNQEEEESSKFHILARLCHSLEIVVFFIVQTAKGDRDNPMGSKKGGHEASIMLRIEFTPPSKDDPLAKSKEFDDKSRVIVLQKNKQNGVHFKEKIAYNPATFKFHNPNLYGKAKQNAEHEISHKYLIQELYGDDLEMPLID